jgi:DNA-binding transcriptional LysR family regulator
MQTIRDTAAGTSGRLRIGFVGSAIYKVIPTIIPPYRSLYPGIELVLRDQTSTQTIQMMDEGALDIGFIRTPLIQSSNATHLTLQRDHFLAAFPKGYRLSERPQLLLKDLAGEPFITYAATGTPGLHASVMAVCQAAGFLPRIAQEAVQLPTILALVESGLGVALVPEVMRGHREHLVVYRTLNDLPETGQTALALAYQSGAESPAVREFIKLAKHLFVSPQSV